jgi:flagellar biosynthesis chaperone FliJ
MSDDNIDLQFLARLSKQSIDEARFLRKELADLTARLQQTYEGTQRIERRQNDPREDLDLTIKMEFAGHIANMQTLMENFFSRMENTLDGLASRVEVLERKP